MSVLLTLKNLSLTYPHKTIFDRVTFTLNYGEKIGVLGLNGHGKSSLLKIIAGLAHADTTTPPFVFDKSKDFSYFYVPQELDQTEHFSVEDYFYHFYPEWLKIKNELDLVNEKLTNDFDQMDYWLEKQSNILEFMTHNHVMTTQEKYLNYLNMFSVKDIKKRVSQLSGGEQKKICLALGLSTPFELILWDEPTNHLDMETIELFEDELSSTNKTFMLISHDRSLLTNVVDRILHIEKGKLKSFQGTYKAYLDYLLEENLKREKELDRLSNIHRSETAWIRRGAKARRTKSKKRIEDYQTLSNKIADIKNQTHKSISLDLKSSGKKSKVLITATGVTFSHTEKPLLNNISLTLAKGEKIALCGKNGTGKSTLIKLLLQEIQPNSGQIKSLEGLTVGYFSQQRDILKEDSTPWELIGEGIDFIISNTGEKRHVASYLEQFLFKSEELKRPISSFSGGEKNRLQLAYFMKHAKDLWIFDEPTNDLDLETIGILEEELKSYTGAVIIISHDRSFLSHITNKCWIIHKNNIEIFESGFEQAEEYLRLIHEEEILQLKSQQQSDFKEKERQKGRKANNNPSTILDEIYLLEEKIKNAESELNSMDYMDRSEKNVNRINKLTHELKELKIKHENLFLQWEKEESNS